MTFRVPWQSLPKDDIKKLAEAVEQNFDELSNVFPLPASMILNDTNHVPSEALGTVTTSSLGPVSLSGGPSITIKCRPGLMIAVLMDAELKQSTTASGETARFAGQLDGGITYVGGAENGSTGYVRYLSHPDSVGNPYPAGALAVFPATATSHTIEMQYYATVGGTASFKNRRIWAFII